LISDHEFESLLDELHGKGKFTEVPASAAAAAPVAARPQRLPPSRLRQPAAKAAPAPAAAAAPARAAAPAAADKPASEAETTVRVDTARLDEIMNMVGELVLVRNRLVRLGLNSGDEAMSKAVSNLDVVTADLQTAVMKTRMQPIKKVFGRFPRLVRDLAPAQERDQPGAGRRRNRPRQEPGRGPGRPAGPLGAQRRRPRYRNPEEREASGKSRNGKVVLAAEQEGDHILLSISDDGKGMDPNVLRAIAVKRA
jgi:two-component system chemotaxis sensor kinase CheA